MKVKFRIERTYVAEETYEIPATSENIMLLVEEISCKPSELRFYKLLDSEVIGEIDTYIDTYTILPEEL